MNYELPPRRRSPLAHRVIDALVWLTCAAFAGSVAVSYLIATVQ